jgi:pimeloyl-ACP methyl ester carboxylesterase
METTMDPVSEYLIDAAQRTVLYWDVMRQRGNQYRAHMAQNAPHVLDYDYEPLIDGRTLPEPVNYGLVRIVPPKGVETLEHKRPFVIIDPRAGHGPGIGGFKADSEIGVVLGAGHPCYFVGFTTRPEPGQTIEAILRAEARFVEHIRDMHPEAEGRPAIIGNCQAGWAVMMLAAVYPELCGPLILAGSPLSYWAGVKGQNPMRYSGGLLGGSWLTALTGDMGNGIFDGAWLVHNFEALNPANTLWSKQYDVYSKVDTEGPRYLDFERWWSGHVLLNAAEMQWIVDQLFVGNKLASADIVLSDGVRVDLRNIRSPIVCFCSKGDNITPPQQALGWIPDLYESNDDIRASGQTIVYTVHESVGHLGIFVSGGVAKKEHREFANNIDLIDCLPPGLYEAVLSAKHPDAVNVELIGGDYISQFAFRSVDDIRAMGENDANDERSFAAVARLSEITHGLYRTTAQPFVRAMVNEEIAEWMRRLHPARLGYELFSDLNPAMKMVESLAERVRAGRQPVSDDNPLLAWQNVWSQVLTTGLDVFRVWRDATQEAVFFAVYGQPFVQALLGLRASDAPPRQHPGTSPEHHAFVEKRVAELRSSMDKGGLREAAIRALVYIRMPTKLADERGFEMLRRIHETEGRDLNLEEFKTLLREQFFMLLLDEERAIKSLSRLIEGQESKAAEVLEHIRQLVTVSGTMTEESTARLEAVAAIFSAAKPRTRRAAAAKKGQPRGPRKAAATLTTGSG